MSSFKDLTGNRFGKLVVEYEASPHYDKNGKKITMWHCKCDCGNEKDVLSGSLTSGNTKSCGCMSKEKHKTMGKERVKDLVGLQFGRLTVLEKTTLRQNGSVCWKCFCECGKECIVSSANLTLGRTKSCGCLRNESIHRHIIPKGKDLTGKRFGMLTVIERSKFNSEDNRTRWDCVCDCGSKITVLRQALIAGDTTSCGCNHMSHGETKIFKTLNDANIRFSTQHQIDGLYGQNGGLLRFDFGVVDDNNCLLYLIEYDGIQHYKSISGWNNEKHLQELKKNDNLKNEYCKSHNIPLIRIPYTHYKDLCIDDLKLETTKFRVV